MELPGFCYFLVFETAAIEHQILKFGGKDILKRYWHSYRYYLSAKYWRRAGNGHM